MPSVFISYKREEAQLAQNVRGKLGELGVDFFMDDELTPDGNYRVELDKQLAEAAAVLVLWTKQSIQSEFVYSEAQKGYRRKVLVAVMFDHLAFDDLPVPFNTFQASNLSDWIETGASANNAQWQTVLEALGRKLERPGLPELAIAFQTGSDDALKGYLLSHPLDASVARINEELAARKDFKDSVRKVQRRIDQWKKEIDKRLDACRADFEKRIAELRRGNEFMPPDPRTALDHNVEFLREQLKNYETAVDQYRHEIEQAEKAATIAAAELGALRTELSSRDAQAGVTDQTTKAMRELNDRLAELRQELDRRDNEISSLRSSSGNVPRLTARAFMRPAVAAAAVLLFLAGLGLGLTMLRDYSGAPLSEAGARQLQQRNGELQRQVTAANQQLETAKSQATQKQSELAAALATISSSQSAGKASEDRIRVAEERGKALQSQLTQSQSREANLQSQFNQTQADKNSLAGQLDRLRTETEPLRSQLQQGIGANAALQSQVKQLQEDIANLRKNQAQPQPQLTRSDPVSRCDDLSAYQYDPDRPPGSQWKETSTEIDVNTALDACEKALRTAGIDNTTRRRLTLQLGRIIATRGMLERGKQQKQSYDDAVEHWKESARLGSSQASNILGVHYQLNKDLANSWKYFKQSADQKNPAGLANAAYFLLFPELHENAVPYNADLGQRYLEDSIKTRHPRAFFVRGRAMMEARGKYQFSPNRDEGLKQVALAFCGNDEEARKFFNRTTDHSAPACT